MCAAVVETLWRGIGNRMSSELSRACARPISDAVNNGCNEQLRPLRVTAIDGQGTGPVVSAAVRKIFKAANVPVEWDYQTLNVCRDHRTNQMTVNSQLLSSATDTGLVLRAQDSTAGHNNTQLSRSLTLNKALNAFVGIRKFESVIGHEPYGPICLMNIRDNVSGEYSEIEHSVVPGVVQSIKTVSRKISTAVAKVAFDYATKHCHHRVTALHKANVMRLSDGMFLKACREVSACYPHVEYNEEKLDLFCLRVTKNPDRYDLLLTTSMYGAFAGAVCGAMAGGLASVPAAAYGPNAAVFSTMSDYGHSNYGHGDDEFSVGRTLYGQEPIINPTGMIRAATWMLDHAGMSCAGHRIATALEDTIRQGIRTRDTGGEATCRQFTDAVIKNLQPPSGGVEECC